MTIYAIGCIAEVKSKVLQEDGINSNPSFPPAHPCRSLLHLSPPCCVPRPSQEGRCWSARTVYELCQWVFLPSSFQLWPIGREQTESGAELFTPRPPSSRLVWQQRSPVLSGGLFHTALPSRFQEPPFRLRVGNGAPLLPTQRACSTLVSLRPSK